MDEYIGKRLGDIIFSLICLFFLSPVFLIVSILIKLFDKGPIFYSQIRVGKAKKNFLFVKFRSLPVSTPITTSDQLGKVKISFIGKFLRRTNIDELPQLVNILKGEMSFVGPRPALNEQKELISMREKNGSIFCRPGLTGLAQVKAYDNMTTKEKAKFDGIYYGNISFFNDIYIIFRTFIYLLSPPPIY